MWYFALVLVLILMVIIGVAVRTIKDMEVELLQKRLESNEMYIHFDHKMRVKQDEVDLMKSQRNLVIGMLPEGQRNMFEMSYKGFADE